MIFKLSFLRKMNALRNNCNKLLKYCRKNIPPHVIFVEADKKL